MNAAPLTPPVCYPIKPAIIADSTVALAPTQPSATKRQSGTVPVLRPLPRQVPVEPWPARWLFLTVALIITCAFWFFIQSFWAPGPDRPGIDENAYLVAGKNIAQHGTPGFQPSDEYQFVDAMWVRTKDQTFAPPGLPHFLGRWLTVHTQAGWYYPKYPAGVPLLNAIAVWIGGPAHGREWAFEISPLCMTLAILGMFFLTRAVAGSFCGGLAMIVLAMGNTSLELITMPGSHAPALCAVVWGIFLLIRWWQSGSIWRGIVAGFLLGHAVTLRYTEALLLFPLYPLDQVLADTGLKDGHPHWWTAIRIVRLLPIGPLGIAVLSSIRWKNRRSYLHAMLPVVAWAIPVGALVALNWFTMGHITGYDTTNESAGFTTGEFFRKWDFTVEEIYVIGLFLIAPLGVAGLAILFQKSVRLGLLFTLWLLPGVLLYTAYYWGNQMRGVVFLRFFLTLFPPLIVGAMWLLRSAGLGDVSTPRSTVRRIAWPLTAGLITAATASLSLWGSLIDMERQHRGNLNLHYSAANIASHINAPHANHARPMAFADVGVLPQLTQYLQFMIDADWYTSDAFVDRGVGGFGVFGLDRNKDPNGPVLIQRERIDHMTEVMKGKTASDLVKEAHHVMDDALAQGRPIYAILTPVQTAQFRLRFITPNYEMKQLDHWVEPCSTHPPFSLDRNNPTPDRRPNSLLAPMITAEPIIRWEPQELTMYEIRRK